jgi:peptidoglycan/xylan/chitin deacetylase (PgdA/CDA1 family)/GT2 family glycosyltransferase
VSDAPSRPLAVLIATHNRCEMLSRCLDALARQSADPASFEVIVADDGSDAATTAMLEELRTPYRLRAVQVGKAGKPAALNDALALVEAEACLFIDDDVIASEGVVAAHIDARRREPRALALGRLVQRPPRRRDAYAAAAAVRWNRRYEELAGVTPAWTDCYGANFSAPRDALAEIGGFDAEMTAVEDLDVGFRLWRAGCVPVYLPDAEALHDDEKPGRRILHHERRFGSWCARFAEAHPEARASLLGWFSDSTVREVTLRRLLLRLRMPPRALAAGGPALPAGGGLRQAWLDFVSRYAFWSGVRDGMDRDTWWQTTRGVPVLMYHAFTETGEEDRYIMPRRSFARQMRLLALLGYRVIEFEALGSALREGQPLPRRSVAITIDDGYADNLEIAHPILRRRGFSATLFLISGKLGGTADWSTTDGATDGRALLSREQAQRLLSEGHAIGAHTRTHRPLPTLAEDDARAEVGGSRADLESALGVSVRTFAYPYGELDDVAVEAGERASFVAAGTVRPRPARFGDDPLRIPRIEVRGSDTTRRFLRKLWLGGE